MEDITRLCEAVESLNETLNSVAGGAFGACLTLWVLSMFFLTLAIKRYKE